MLNELAIEAHRIAREHGWWEGRHRELPELIALMHSELSEALDAWRRNAPAEDVWEEFADVIIRILDVAAAQGIDLDKAVSLKMVKNQERPFRHGGLLI